MISTPYSRAFLKRCLFFSIAAVSGCTAVALTCGSALGKMSILDSPHNLSAGSAYKDFNFENELRICIFCHAPHNARPVGHDEGFPAPLWNRDLSAVLDYKPYGQGGSLTLKATVSQPTGSSRLCLSCHDGTIALNAFGGSTIPGGITKSLPVNRPSNLAKGDKNLADDHPISFVYDDALVALKNGELASPLALPPATKLDQAENLQCTTCHDPHDNEFGKFLVMKNSDAGSPLCITCHTYTRGGATPAPAWSESPHYSATIGDPLTSGTTGCMNCHTAHNAPQPNRLLRYPIDKDNCLNDCHKTGQKALTTAFNQFYKHPLATGPSLHVEGESLPATIPHVECADCHNPHRAVPAADPNGLTLPFGVDGPLQGVRTNNQNDIAANEYDICFKCHAGSNASFFSKLPPNRVIPDSEQRNRFNSMNPSFHPVTAPTGATNASQNPIPLRADMSRIYCCDCHDSDKSAKAGGLGANGPHSSFYEHILIAEYDMPLAPQPPGPGNYPIALYTGVDTDKNFYKLCYRCHDQTFIMGQTIGSRSAFFDVPTGHNLHQKHVQVSGVPCFACHDPHGVPKLSSSAGGLGGATSLNNAHLINFNKDYAGNAPIYTTNAPGTGSCTVACHAGERKYPSLL
jgi:predicted CXXCH cytochrome family protein